MGHTKEVQTEYLEHLIDKCFQRKKEKLKKYPGHKIVSQIKNMKTGTS